MAQQKVVIVIVVRGAIGGDQGDAIELFLHGGHIGLAESSGFSKLYSINLRRSPLSKFNSFRCRNGSRESAINASIPT